MMQVYSQYQMNLRYNLTFNDKVDQIYLLMIEHSNKSIKSIPTWYLMFSLHLNYTNK